MSTGSSNPPPPSRGSALEVFAVALRLGLTSFGGPVAHLGYFHEEYVVRRKWLDDRAYGDLIALCQFLPGPASSQVGIAIGLIRAGLPGALAAWVGFTLPSAVALVIFAYGVQGLGEGAAAWLHGFKVVAVAVVALALWGMARALAPDRARATIVVAAALVTLLWPTAAIQVLIIAGSALISWRVLRAPTENGGSSVTAGVSRRLAIGAWALLLTLLVGLPMLRQLAPSQPLAVFDSFFRVGSLVFGGGHVVLPLLHGEVVPPGWISDEEFVAGYGAAQAVPGPLFTLSAFLGARILDQPSAWGGGGLALVAIFLPSFLLIIGALPFWEDLRARAEFQAALRGINAAVVGLLLAALYDPVWTSAIHRPADFGLALIALGALAFWRVPPWLVVALTATGGAGARAVGVM